MNSDGDLNWATQISSYYFSSFRFQFVAFIVITVAVISSLHLKKKAFAFLSQSLPSFSLQ